MEWLQMVKELMLAPGWSSNVWSWILLAVGVGSLVYAFVAKRTKNKLDDRGQIVVDVLHSQVATVERETRRREERDSAKRRD